MPLLDADIFLDQVEGVRIVNCCGYVRSGKTALSVRLAYELLINRPSMKMRYIVPNVRCVFGDNVEDIVLRENFYMDTVFIFDELGQFVETEFQAKQMRAFMGKLNNVIISATVDDIPRSLKTIQVWRSFNFWRFGIPIWKYSYTVGKTLKGSFYWLLPSEIFGTYDSSQVITSDKGIVQYIRKYITRVQGDEPNRENISVGEGSGPSELRQEEIERIRSLIEAVSD